MAASFRTVFQFRAVPRAPSSFSIIAPVSRERPIPFGSVMYIARPFARMTSGPLMAVCRRYRGHNQPNVPAVSKA